MKVGRNVLKLSEFDHKIYSHHTISNNHKSEVKQESHNKVQFKPPHYPQTTKNAKLAINLKKQSAYHKHLTDNKSVLDNSFYEEIYEKYHHDNNSKSFQSKEKITKQTYKTRKVCGESEHTHQTSTNLNSMMQGIKTIEQTQADKSFGSTVLPPIKEVKSQVSITKVNDGLVAAQSNINNANSLNFVNKVSPLRKNGRQQLHVDIFSKMIKPISENAVQGQLTDPTKICLEEMKDNQKKRLFKGLFKPKNQGVPNRELNYRLPFLFKEPEKSTIMHKVSSSFII